MTKKKTDTPRSFAHDSNARNSEKIIKLRLAHGAAGYGVYFMLLERLRDTPDYQATIDYDVLAFDLRESPELIRSVIEDFGLFVISDDGREFYSPTMSARMKAQFAPPAPVAPAPAEPDAEPDSERTQALQRLVRQVCADGQWIADVAQQFDVTPKYVSKKLRTDIRAYCLGLEVLPANADEFRALAFDWFSGRVAPAPSLY